MSRSTDQVGVCIGTSGPGATNFATCLANAKMDSIPLVCITGQVGTGVIGTDAFQETPMVEISRPITKHHYLVTRAEDIARVVKEAFHIARTGRPGPVLIDIPKDVQNRKIVPHFNEAMILPGYRPDRRAPDAALDQIVEWIGQSQRPVIYAGGGINLGRASGELRELVRHTGIPVAMTLQGLGAFPADDPLSLNMLGMHGTVFANYAVHEADLLLALGVRFDDRVMGKISEFCGRGRIVHVDIDPSELNKNKKAHLAVEGDVKDALVRLNARLCRRSRTTDLGSWQARIAEWRREFPLRYHQAGEDILPQHAIRRLREIVKERGLLDQTIVTTGVGQHQMWTAQFWNFNKPNLWVTSGGLGAMGFGLPAALGAQAGNPEKLVIDVDGDGSFLMNCQELACAFTENLPIKVLLLNNQHLGMVAQWEDRFYDRNRGHTYLGAGTEWPPYPDFVALARAFRWGARQVSQVADLDAALAAMLDQPGPFLLDVVSPYQEHVLPMIPAGLTIRDMIHA